MAINERLAGRVREYLDNQHDAVREIKMMGGLIFMVREHMCCGVDDDRLMIRVGPVVREEALAREHVVALDIGGGRRPAAFICVEAPGISTEKRLHGWIDKAIAYVRTLPEKKAKPKKKVSKKKVAKKS